MQQLLPAAAALCLVLWLLRRPRPRLMPVDDGTAVAALNRAQIEQLRPPRAAAPDLQATAGGAAVSPLPSDERERVRFLRQLNAACRGSDAERRAAMSACLRWGDRAALPLLLRGRRDPDPHVAELAALGLERFRGRSAAAVALPIAQAEGLPRNVARTR